MPWLGPSVPPFRRHSHKVRMTPKTSFHGATWRSSFFRYSPLKYLPELCLVSKQRSNIFHGLSLWATVHVARPGSAWELSVAPHLPPFSRSRGVTTTHLICIPLKPCSKKGEKLQATGNQMGKSWWTPRGQLPIQGDQCLIGRAAGDWQYLPWVFADVHQTRWW